MGMYTEIFITCGLKENLPKDVENVCKFLFGNGESPEVLPDHDLFRLPRWSLIGRCCSYYFVPESTSKLWWSDIAKKYYLTSRSDLKNYDGEIQKFIDWITPYVDEPEGQFFAYSRYEESDAPTLYFVPETAVA